MTIDGLFLPKDGNHPPSLLVLLLVSVYVSLSKNSFLRAAGDVSPLADAKVRLFRETPNFFTEKFQIICEKETEIDKNQVQSLLTPYYIIYKGAILL